MLHKTFKGNQEKDRRMSNGSKIIDYVMGLGIVVFAAWLLWVFVANINAADSSVKAGLIGLLGMFSAALITNYLTKKREIDARHFADKREGYMHLIDMLFDILMSTKNNEKINEEEMLKKIIPFKKTLLVWGEPNIIDAWNHYEMRSEEGLAPKKIIREMEMMLRAIRKDLGHDDSQLKFLSLLALIINAKDKKKFLEEEEEEEEQFT